MAQPHVSSHPTPLIVDDDGSQDGMTALAFMLANPKFDVKAITIAQGVARPKVFGNNLAKMLTRLGETDIPVGVGRSTPLEGNNAFPDFVRDASDTFWAPFVTVPEEAKPIKTQNAVDLLIKTIKNSPDPVTILATGTLTNIAEALRRDPSIIDNIEVVEIMGGAAFVPGNLPFIPDPPYSTNTVAEFNIWVDPVAAQEVFEAGKQGLKIQVTPLDATGKIEFSRDDYQAWLATGTPESRISAEFLDFALSKIQSGNDPNPVWDLVAAINLSQPSFSPETPLYIDVDTESDPGATQGQTKVIPGLSPNALVSLNPTFDNLPFSASSLFKYIDALSKLPSSRIRSGTAKSDTLIGAKTDELISGLNGNDAISGKKGSDVLLAGGGNDTVKGGSGKDFIDGGSGNDILCGNRGKDILIAGTGNDSMFGGAQADIILAGSGNDTLRSGGGADTLRGGEGNDILYGGRGSDLFVLAAKDGTDTVQDFRDGCDRFGLAAGLTFGQLSITQSNSNMLIRLSATNEVLASLTGVNPNLISAEDFTTVA